MIDLYNGDCLEVLKGMEDNSIDACVTDPPYGLNFMGASWDADVPSPEYWKEILRVLKPGGFLLCFAGTRMWHWMGVSIEKGGFQIKDTVLWLNGQGMPKNYNIAKGIESRLTTGSANNVNFKTLKGEREEGAIGYQKLQAKHNYRPADYTGRGAKFDLEATTEEAKFWDGYGTSLCPAWEPVIIAMKPNDKDYVNNALTWNVAGINIDGTRIPIDGKITTKGGEGKLGNTYNWKNTERDGKDWESHKKGRWPKNVIIDEDVAEMIDEQTGGIEKAGFVRNRTDGARPFNNEGKDTGYKTTAVIEEKPAGKSRFFYCVKANKKEKEMGLEEMEDHLPTHGKSHTKGGFQISNSCLPVKNNHPTVKPLELMRYLCTLVKSPYNGIILDPFMGSGTTGMACVLEGIPFIGIEMSEEYFNIAKKRIDYIKKESA